MMNYSITQLGSADAQTYMVLAAGKAAMGEFKDAMNDIKQAIVLAKKENNRTLLAKLQQQMAFYRKSTPLPGA
jgi:uncharacterized membrane protein (DUF106 family)